MYSLSSRTVGIPVGRLVVSPAQRSSGTSRGPQFGQVTSIDMAGWPRGRYCTRRNTVLSVEKTLARMSRTGQPSTRDVEATVRAVEILDALADGGELGTT